MKAAIAAAVAVGVARGGTAGRVAVAAANARVRELVRAREEHERLKAKLHAAMSLDDLEAFTRALEEVTSAAGASAKGGKDSTGATDITDGADGGKGSGGGSGGGGSGGTHPHMLTRQPTFIESGFSTKSEYDLWRKAGGVAACGNEGEPCINLWTAAEVTTAS